LYQVSQPSLPVKLLAVMAIIVSIALGFVAWSSLMGISLELAAQYAVRVSLESISRQMGIMRSARAVSMMCGGGIWLAVALVGISFHWSFLGKRRSWKVLGWTIGAEAVLIGLDALI
jgi:hypothetical protein